MGLVDRYRNAREKAYSIDRIKYVSDCLEIRVNVYLGSSISDFKGRQLISFVRNDIMDKFDEEFYYLPEEYKQAIHELEIYSLHDVRELSLILKEGYEKAVLTEKPSMFFREIFIDVLPFPIKPRQIILVLFISLFYVLYKIYF
ncbi:hypothetical protein GCM10008931_31300 [Oceanobacillus oncorhynchi subsp. oncorhynchi]|uniref:hypothetical protein n=1 Tax=Oceanobacillus oncorhynchi TaxID=545501 RepID=UPI0031D20EE2